MVVVSDTSPVSNLAIIGRLDLLKEQFGTVLVPAAVSVELTRLGAGDAHRSIETAYADGWLRIIPLERRVSMAIALGLHSGESEALGLAVEQRADLVLLDDGDARKRAAEIGLSFVGVLGILLRGKRQGRLTSMLHEMRRLHTEAHFFIAPKLEAEVLELSGEERNGVPSV